ncbi:hypothetical protein CHLNCDRAFT_134195 [Chlorella variabilis]|uniref:Major facilitator superfamily (MFS) profile domain-containing protein n=1 Tax=Chlorella variabilis TaxID=554065 RepID=E1ZFH0_CHLVA|nr:hypothetical protein CHLNCDRAFT_134195 [Chlorella variabilis]EFN55132.1 hypothetical protein CHLNCDRAFT_134195 [Chlorella variabilis]|eukprot:XP_005847234.1 hypothetical protein CHLNCDRAFT_134195 [Chlorella variabilis]
MAVAESDLGEDAAVDPAAVIRKLDRHLIPWLFSLGILCYLDRTNLSFAALDLNRDLHLSCSTYGLGASLFFISYALFQMPSTVVCARLGAHIWLSANIVAWGAVAAMFALASSVPAFLALRFLLGATESAAFPGMWYHLSTFYSEAEMGPAYAKVASCTAVAQVVGAPLAAGILAMDGVGGLRGWQWLFILEGGATVVFGALLRFALAPSPAKARMLTRAEREWLRHRQETARTAMGAAGQQGAHPQAREGGGSTCAGFMHQFKGTLGVVRDWRILWLSGCWLLVAAVMFGMTFFMPLLVSAMFSGGGAISGVSGGGGGGHGACHSDDGDGESGGEGERQHSSLVALASAVPFMLAAVGMNINARLAGRANERHRHAGVPILLAGILLGLVPLAARTAGPGLAFALLSMTAGLCWSFHGPFFSWPAVFLPNEQAAAGFAFINSIGAVGGFIGPYLLGVLSDRGDGGFGTAMLVLACFLLVSGTLILLFPAPGHREEQAVTVSLKPSDPSGEYSLAPAGDRSSTQCLSPRDEEEQDGDMESQQRPAGWQQRHSRHKAASSAGQLSEVEFQPILDGARST